VTRICAAAVYDFDDVATIATAASAAMARPSSSSHQKRASAREYDP
jgi:hypothetical protein